MSEVDKELREAIASLEFNNQYQMRELYSGKEFKKFYVLPEPVIDKILALPQLAQIADLRRQLATAVRLIEQAFGYPCAFCDGRFAHIDCVGEKFLREVKP